MPGGMVVRALHAGGASPACMHAAVGNVLVRSANSVIWALTHFSRIDRLSNQTLSLSPAMLVH